jgi:hypothetical protein
MKKSFLLFLMALIILKKDSHAGFGINHSESEKSKKTEEAIPFLSFLQNSNPDSSETEKINQLFQDLSPPKKRSVFFACFDGSIDKKGDCNRETFKIRQRALQKFINRLNQARELS